MKLFLILILTALLLALTPACAAEAGTELEIYCFRAGKADAFLITTPDSAVLMDCGLKSLGGDIVEELRSRGIRRLDALIITHFDKDHVGGAARVIESIPIGTVYQNDCLRDSSQVESYLAALEKAGITPVTVTADMSFSLDSVSWRIDAPAGDYEKDISNNNSLIITVKNGGDTLVFMGDAEKARIEEYLMSRPGKADFLKVPHHGAMEDNSAALFGTLQADAAVITSSDDEPEDGDVVKLLEEAGGQVYLTRQGPVTFRTSGRGILASQEED